LKRPANRETRRQQGDGGWHAPRIGNAWRDVAKRMREFGRPTPEGSASATLLFQMNGTRQAIVLLALGIQLTLDSIAFSG